MTSGQHQSNLQRTAAKNNSTHQQPKTKVSVSSKLNNRQLILPPFKSELDAAAAQSNASNSNFFYRASSAGNTYYRGYCTWYAKSKRPDLPNGLGNAITWYARAQAMGLPTGTEPKVGAIGQQGNHVVYVEKVNADGTVSISEMNFQGFGIVSSRTVPASNFRYIY